VVKKAINLFSGEAVLARRKKKKKNASAAQVHSIAAA